jgi:hypothetical protein
VFDADAFAGALFSVLPLKPLKASQPPTPASSTSASAPPATSGMAERFGAGIEDGDAAA